mgnify:CR=1 FL=1
MNKDLEFLTRVIDEKSAKILDANDKIWEYAELAFPVKINLKRRGLCLDGRRCRNPDLLYRNLFLRNRKTCHGNPRRV